MTPDEIWCNQYPVNTYHLNSGTHHSRGAKRTRYIRAIENAPQTPKTELNAPNSDSTVALSEARKAIDWKGLNTILRTARARNESVSLELTNWIADNQPSAALQQPDTSEAVDGLMAFPDDPLKRFVWVGDNQSGVQVWQGRLTRNEMDKLQGQSEAVRVLVEACEQVVIAHGMGWDMDGVIQVLTDKMKEAANAL